MAASQGKRTGDSRAITARLDSAQSNGIAEPLGAGLQLASTFPPTDSSMRIAPTQRGRAAALAAALAALTALPAHASFLSGEALDKAADVVALVVLFVVPIVVIVVFWLVHVLPERFAEQRHHPQAKAIQVLCLLSLFFGGLLWPLAWLWAFTKPVAHRMAYGTDKAEEWHEEMGEKAKAGALVDDEIAHLRHELDAMAARGALPANLKRLRSELDQIAAAPKPAPGAAPTVAEGGA
jgi:hypothetical protein